MNVKPIKTVYILWFVIFIVWSLYRVTFTLPEWIDEIVWKPLVFVLPVILFVKFKEKRSFQSIGLTLKNFFQETYLGIGIGLLFALEGIAANYLKYQTFSFASIAALSKAGLIPFLFYSLFTGFCEEVLGRGFVYGRLYENTKRQFYSASMASLLFLLLHIPILFTQLHLTGAALIIYPVSVFLLGMTNSYLYTWRGSLIVPILVHIFWNATIALYL